MSGKGDDGWHTAVNVREQRRKERKQENKKQAADEREKMKQAEMEEKQKLEMEELERRKKLQTSFSIDVNPNTNISALKKQTKRRTTAKRKKSNSQKDDGPSSRSANITLNQVKGLFSEFSSDITIDLQLKRLAECFENGFESVLRFSVDDILGIHPIDENTLIEEYAKPLSYVSQPVRSTVSGWLTRVPKDDLEAFFWFVIDQLLILKDNPNRIDLPGDGMGLQALLQLVIPKNPALFKSDSFLKRMKQFLVTPKKSQLQASIQDIVPIQNVLNQDSIPLFTWIFFQLIECPGIYLSVWYQYLLPLICYRSCSDQIWNLVVDSYHAVFNKEEVLSAAANAKDTNDSVIGLERLIILYHSLEHPQLKEDVKVIYDSVVKNLSITSTPKSGRHYFAMLLSHAAVSGKDVREEDLRDDICRLLFETLCSDSECFIRWEDIYPRFIPQSNNLLLYILLGWDKLYDKIDHFELVKEARSFIAINKKILSGKFKIKIPRGVENPKLNLKKQNIRVCTVTCEALITKVNTSYSTLILKYGFIIVVLISILFYYFCISNGCSTELCELIKNCPKSK